MTTCARCAGLTVPELLRDGGTISLARRCVLCGDLVDCVILRHRTRHLPPRPQRARTPVYGQKWAWKRRTAPTGS